MNNKNNKNNKNNNYRNFNIFLNRYRVEKGSVATHLAQPNPGKHRSGRFNIPDDNLNEFYDILSKLEEPASISENHLPDRSPIIIDLDFRQKCTIFPSKPVKLYNRDNIKTFMTQLYAIIRKYVDNFSMIPIETSGLVVLDKSLAYIMEKTHKTAGVDGIIKGGIHIVFPILYLPYSILYLIRNDVINNPVIINMFKDMGLDNTPDNIYDKLVIEKNSWMMYCNSKPGSDPYIITEMYFLDVKKHTGTEDLNKDDVQMNIRKVRDVLNNGTLKKSLIKSLSIRRKIKNTETKISLEEAQSLHKNIQQPIQSLVKRNFNIQNTSEVLEFSKFLVKNSLSLIRVDQYDLWMDLALCLSSINPQLRKTFIEFSKLSYKYVDEQDCDKVWNRMPKINHLNALEQLLSWVKSDN
jgi:hypothetical protein